jgi:membrane-bound lytic murein transglycosylase A
MKGKVFTLPDGKTFIHPGYFIVEDIGGDIQGPNRFDFFTGSYSATDVRNPFGYEGDEMVMTDRRMCEARKQFKVIRRGKGKEYNTSLAMIESTLQTLDATRMVASKDGYTFKGIQ